MNEILENLDKVHTTKLGAGRIKRNLDLSDSEDAAAWCKQKIENADFIIKSGKNWYVYADDSVITINAGSCTIITAKRSGTRHY